MRLILASASPRRADLLRAAGYTFETVVVEVDERARAGEQPAEYVRRLALEKSAKALSVVCGLNQAAVSTEGEPHVLGADTAVVIDGRILGKPTDDADAERMLRALSGRTHEVLTGVSLRGDGREVGCVISTAVRFNPLSGSEIAWYIRTGEGRDKAGGYAIQGLASRFVPAIDGSYSNVVGLPVAAVAELIQELHPA